jgi:GrpB-like predicted nucleotidyltransferase (UPF0157 family)
VVSWSVPLLQDGLACVLDGLDGGAEIGSLERVDGRCGEGAALVELGYETLGEAGVPGRIHLRRRGSRAFNVSVVPLQSDLWRDNLMFREHLRSNREARQRYADAKQRAVEAGCTSLLDYSDFKGPTVEKLAAQANAGAE